MITILCGVAGKGKTALATQQAILQATKGRLLFSNYNISYKVFGVPLTSFDCPPEYFKNKSFPEDSFIILDEAQNQFNSRFFKDMTKEEIKYFSGHRHLGNDIWITTQHPNRVDVVLRENADKFIWIRHAFPFGIKIAYEYYLAEHVGQLPPIVPKDFVKLRIYKVSNKTYTQYDDKYLKDELSQDKLDLYPSHIYKRSKYQPAYIRFYKSIKKRILFYKSILAIKKQNKTIGLVACGELENVPQISLQKTEL